jgi:hypothetical protein
VRRLYARVLGPNLRPLLVLAAVLVTAGVLGLGSVQRSSAVAAPFSAAIAAVEAFGEEACARYEQRSGGSCVVVVFGAVQGADGVIYVSALLEGNSERGALVIPAVLAVSADGEVLGVAAS